MPKNIADLQPGDRFIYAQEGKPTEVFGGEFYERSPSGRFICLNGRWSEVERIRLIEDLPSYRPPASFPAAAKPQQQPTDPAVPSLASLPAPQVPAPPPVPPASPLLN